MSYLNTIDEIRSYRKICDEAILKLKKLLRKHHQPTQLFWSDYNDNDDDEITDDESTDDESTDDESTDESGDEICRKIILDINSENNSSNDER
jgi:hypothetical protein